MAGVHAYPDPADHPDAQPFIRAVVAGQSGPDDNDQLPRMVFADWLDDQGYWNASQGQRWAARYNRRPKFAHSPTNSAHGVGWLYGGHIYDAPNDISNSKIPAFLPGPFFTSGLSRAAGQYGQDPLLLRSGDPHDHERAYLSRTQQMGWHPETGEPLNPDKGA